MNLITLMNMNKNLKGTILVLALSIFVICTTLEHVNINTFYWTKLSVFYIALLATILNVAGCIKKRNYQKSSSAIELVVDVIYILSFCINIIVA